MEKCGSPGDIFSDPNHAIKALKLSSVRTLLKCKVHVALDESFGKTSPTWVGCVAVG